MTPCALCQKPLTSLHLRIHPQPPTPPRESPWVQRAREGRLPAKVERPWA